MNTPICDFVNNYIGSVPVRLHMPGHKGKDILGCERSDITEIDGADVLYGAGGIIAESEKNAAGLFGTAGTFYSAEGSSLVIRAMLFLVKAYSGKKRPLIAAGRNAHLSFVSAAALMGIDVRFVYPRDSVSFYGALTPEDVGRALAESDPDAVYITSPDYAGNIADIEKISRICHKKQIPLLVDNAHGAYLKFLKTSLHPADLGADLVADSAHKTLPVLTGGAYMHISREAPRFFLKEAERSLGVFASTSPSYLILQSLDMANKLLSGDYAEKIRIAARRLDRLRAEIARAGYILIGNEPLKLTIDAASYGIAGTDLKAILKSHNIYCEAADPEVIIMMFSADTEETVYDRLWTVLSGIERKPPLKVFSPGFTPGQRVMELDEALYARSETVSAGESVGRILTGIISTCPPCVPLAVPGEIIGDFHAGIFNYYGIDSVRVACRPVKR